MAEQMLELTTDVPGRWRCLRLRMGCGAVAVYAPAPVPASVTV